MINALSLLPLSMVSSGKKALLVEIRGSSPMNRRLTTLGLTAGKVVHVIPHDPTGPMRLKIRDDAHLSLGRGVAQRVMVTLID